MMPCVGFVFLGTAGWGIDGVFPILELAGNGISIVLLIFTILEFCIAVATANFWCRATRLSSNEVGGGGGGRDGSQKTTSHDPSVSHNPDVSQAMLIVPSATRVDLAVPPAELPQPPSYTEVIQGIAWIGAEPALGWRLG